VSKVSAVGGVASASNACPTAASGDAGHATAGVGTVAPLDELGGVARRSEVMAAASSIRDPPPNGGLARLDAGRDAHHRIAAQQDGAARRWLAGTGGIASGAEELAPEHMRVGQQRAVIVLANKPGLRVGQQVPMAAASAVARVDVPQSRTRRSHCAYSWA
jgi:hypothetical protein